MKKNNLFLILFSIIFLSLTGCAEKFANNYFIGKYLDFSKMDKFLNEVDLVTIETEIFH